MLISSWMIIEGSGIVNCCREHGSSCPESRNSKPKMVDQFIGGY